MLKIQNNRMHYGGVSFSLPNRMYLETAPALEYENGMEFYAEDKSFSITFGFTEYEETAEENIKKLLQSIEVENDSGRKPPSLDDIKPFKINELNGFALLYGCGLDVYFDSANKSNIHPYLYIDKTRMDDGSYMDISIDEILNRPGVQDFFADIRVEKES